MSRQPVIDGFEFASAGATQRGTWPLKELPRLRDVLAQDAGEVAYEITGVRDARGRPGLRLKVSGTMVLRCQRCLEPMEFAVNTDETLVLAATLDEIHAEPADAHAPDRVDDQWDRSDVIHVRMGHEHVIHARKLLDRELSHPGAGVARIYGRRTCI